MIFVFTTEVHTRIEQSNLVYYMGKKTCTWKIALGLVSKHLGSNSGSAICYVSLNKVVYCPKPQFYHWKNGVIMPISQCFCRNLSMHLALAMSQKLKEATLASISMFGVHKQFMKKILYGKHRS